MRLETEFIKLPIRFDAERLLAEVLQFDEADWLPHPQGHPGNSALPLIAAYGDPKNDATKGSMQPTAHLDRCLYLQQVLGAFQTVIGRTRLMRLESNAEATPHIDTNYYWFQRVRVHVPVLTYPEVRFLCAERSLHMAAGEAWIFDTWQTHNVVNPKPTRRIHLVADTVGSPFFWELVERGERPFHPATHWHEPITHIPFQPELKTELALEQVNHPVVMSPWEQESLLILLFTELEKSGVAQAEATVALQKEVTWFQRQWRVVWTRYGERQSGWPFYRDVLQQMQERLKPFVHCLRLPNGSDAVEILRQMVIRPALNPDLAEPEQSTPVRLTDRRVSQPHAHRVERSEPVRSSRRIERPIFIVSPPRSGSSLLFETLARSPSVYTIGGESHALFETIPKLHPASRGFVSNRLTAAEADLETAEQLITAFLPRLRNHDGEAPAPNASRVRLLEKTPKNALRVPFLRAVFPDAFFVYLYRDPREEISSIIEAWRSKRFVTYPQLPGWEGPPWSLLLFPGWQSLAGKPLREIAAAQWATTTRYLLDDLEQLPSDRWCIASYERLVSDPQAEIERLCKFVDIDWDQELTAPLPLARHTITPPDAQKWRRNATALEAMMPTIADVAARARDFFAQAPRPVPVSPVIALTTVSQTNKGQPQTPAPVGISGEKKPEGHPFRSGHTAHVPEILRDLQISLLVSTYQSGRIIAVREEGGRLNTHFRSFQSPMGIAVGKQHLAIGTKCHVWQYRNQPAVAQKLDPPGKHDACFLPRSSHVTGDIRIHELAFAENELWLVNTRFSCLCTLDDEHSFVPRWRPRFVSHLAPEDRCHLNGITVIENRVRFATALGQTNTAQGWREHKANGGCVIDVGSSEIVAAGLSMPHSPRWYEGRFWILESGKGTLAILDLRSGKVETVVELPGFTRGLAFAGPYAFVGLSQVREGVFGGIPLTERLQDRACGVWVVNIRSGRIVGFLRFAEAIQEIFDIQVLAGIRYPELSDPEGDLITGAYVLPDAALADVSRVQAGT